MSKKGNVYKGFKPRQDRALIKQDDAAKTTKGGLILPDELHEMPNQGVVLAVSEELTDLKVGETVLFSPNAGLKVLIDGVSYILIRGYDAYETIE